MKKTLVTILTVALMLLMVLPASAEITDPSEARVAIVIYPSSNTTIQVMMSGFLQTAEELGMKTLYIGGDTADNATVEQMIDTAMDRISKSNMVFLMNELANFRGSGWENYENGMEAFTSDYPEYCRQIAEEYGIAM